MKKIFFILIVFISVAFVFCGCNASTDCDDSLASYNITAVFDLNAGTLKCRQQVYFVNNTDDALSEIWFNLYPSAFREDASIQPISDDHIEAAYYDGVSYGNIEIETVTENTQDAVYEIIGQDKTVLCVKTSSVLERGDSISLGLDYVVTLPKTHSRFGITKSGANLCNFYPVLCPYQNGSYREAPYYAYGDPFISEVADYTVTMFYPARGVMAATGKECERYVENGIACSVFTAQNVRDFAAVYLSDGKVISDRTGKTDINYYFTTDSSPETSLATGKTAIDTYQKLFGTYPYETYNIVDTDFIYGGMEYPCLVLINNELTGFNREYTLAHETAHQWWYGLVGSDSVNESWQDEGLTEFSTALYFKHTDREALFNSIINNAYDTYVYASKALAGRGEFDGVMRKAVYDFSTEVAYVITAYDKGMMLNNCLYNLLGEKGYLDACRNYLNANRYQIATADEYLSAFSKCKPLINNWLNGNVTIGATK